MVLVVDPCCQPVSCMSVVSTPCTCNSVFNSKTSIGNGGSGPGGAGGALSTAHDVIIS